MNMMGLILSAAYHNVIGAYNCVCNIINLSKFQVIDVYGCCSITLYNLTDTLIIRNI